MWAAAVQALYSNSNYTKGHIKVKVQGMTLWRASAQPCRAINPKTNETNKSFLLSAGFVAKLAIEKRIVGLKTYLVGSNTTTAKHLHSHRNLSSQLSKTEPGKMLYTDI